MGCSPTEDSDSSAGGSEEWNGVVTVRVLETDTGLGQAYPIFTVSEDQYLLVPLPGATVVGINQSDGGLRGRGLERAT